MQSQICRLDERRLNERLTRNSALFEQISLWKLGEGVAGHSTGKTMSTLRESVGSSITTAFAETQWERNHPRRDQVNDRLSNQNHRINKELKEGEITKQQANQLHREDHAIRQEERTMAKFGSDNEWKARGKIVAVPRDEPDACAIAPGHDAEAIETRRAALN
jgi:hypothetical protein